jgi:hypothetical protein
LQRKASKVAHIFLLIFLLLNFPFLIQQKTLKKPLPPLVKFLQNHFKTFLQLVLKNQLLLNLKTFIRLHLVILIDLKKQNVLPNNLLLILILALLKNVLKSLKFQKKIEVKSVQDNVKNLAINLLQPLKILHFKRIILKKILQKIHTGMGPLSGR